MNPPSALTLAQNTVNCQYSTIVLVSHVPRYIEDTPLAGHESEG